MNPIAVGNTKYEILHVRYIPTGPSHGGCVVAEALICPVSPVAPVSPLAPVAES